MCTGSGESQGQLPTPPDASTPHEHARVGDRGRFRPPAARSRPRGRRPRGPPTYGTPRPRRRKHWADGARAAAPHAPLPAARRVHDRDRQRGRTPPTPPDEPRRPARPPPTAGMRRGWCRSRCGPTCSSTSKTRGSRWLISEGGPARADCSSGACAVGGTSPCIPRGARRSGTLPPTTSWSVPPQRVGSAGAVWSTVPAVVDVRWRDRFGAAELDALSGALRTLFVRLPVVPPAFLPVVYPTQNGKAEPLPPSSSGAGALPAQLSALLSGVLVAFALDAERTFPDLTSHRRQHPARPSDERGQASAISPA